MLCLYNGWPATSNELETTTEDYRTCEATLRTQKVDFAQTCSLYPGTASTKTSPTNGA